MTARVHHEGVDTTESPAALVTRYLYAFLSGDLDTARSMVSKRFSFRAPFIDGGSKEVFFAGSERKVGLIRDFRIVHQWADGNDVSTIYEIDVLTTRGAASMLMHEWHHVRDGELASSVMIFDMVAPAAKLIREELTLPGAQ